MEIVPAVGCMFLYGFTTSQVIIQQGDPGDAFYVIRSGEARVFVQTNEGQDQARSELFWARYDGCNHGRIQIC